MASQKEDFFKRMLYDVYVSCLKHEGMVIVYARHWIDERTSSDLSNFSSFFSPGFPHQ